MNLPFNFIPIAKAQGLDALAQPTFGALNLSTDTPVTNNVQVLLAATNSTTVATGSKFKVTVELKTGSEIQLSNYQLVLKYDPQKLSVVDQDALIAGTQILKLDGIFEVDAPAASNNIVDTTNGKIFFKASGIPITINRKVIEIEFQAQQLGSTQVTIDTTPIEGTRLQKTGTDIPYNPSTLTLQVNQTGTSQSCNQNSECPTGQECLPSKVCAPVQQTACTSNANCLTGQTCLNGFCSTAGTSCTTNANCLSNQVCVNSICISPTPTPSVVLPRTALGDDIRIGFTIFFGIFLIGFGLYLRFKRHEGN
jgi:hypothetical protein